MPSAKLGAAAAKSQTSEPRAPLWLKCSHEGSQGDQARMSAAPHRETTRKQERATPWNCRAASSFLSARSWLVRTLTAPPNPSSPAPASARKAAKLDHNPKFSAPSACNNARDHQRDEATPAAMQIMRRPKAALGDALLATSQLKIDLNKRRDRGRRISRPRS